MHELVLEPNEQDYQEMSELMRYLRSENREVLFVPVAKLQLAHLKQLITNQKDQDPERAKQLTLFARGVCFNIASFTWPGWDDSSEPISEQHQQLGLAAANYGVELAEGIGELTSNILWIRGAHQLNAGEYKAAVQSFEQSESLSEDDFSRLVQSTWAQLVRTVEGTDTSALGEFENQLDKIRSSEHEYAAFHAEQIETARKVYSSN